MNPVDRFEGFIERLMERIFVRAAHSRLQPVEIGKRLVRAMESRQSVGMEGVLVPNVYDIYLSPDDFAHFEPMQRSLVQNMQSHLGRVARQQQYHILGDSMVVTLAQDKRLARGDIRIDAQSKDVPNQPPPSQHTSVLPSLGGEFPASTAAPNLRLNGHTYAVLRTPTRLGRLPDNDIVVNDKRVSRYHAEIVQRGGTWLVRDTGSTNGTAINGRLVREAPLTTGDRISLGGLEATWEQ